MRISSVQDRGVFTDSDTRYEDGTCQQIRNGGEVEVDGDLLFTGRVYAKRIDVKK